MDAPLSSGGDPRLADCEEINYTFRYSGGHISTFVVATGQCGVLAHHRILLVSRPRNLAAKSLRCYAKEDHSSGHRDARIGVGNDRLRRSVT